MAHSTAVGTPSAEGVGATVAAQRVVQISQGPVRWLERGDGPPVVLLHGIPTSPELWRYVIEDVPDARLLAWEMVGYGRSWATGRGTDISLKRQAEYLVEWLDAMEIDRAVLAGHDLGGGVAQIVATRHRDRCAGLVLTNAVCYDSWPIPEVKAMRAAGPLVERLPPALVRAQLALLLRQGHDDAGRARESLKVHWRGYDHRRGPEALIRQIRSLRTEDTLEIAGELPSLELPAAVVWGEADRFQKAPYGRRLAGDLDAGFEPVEGGKHFVPEDHPARVAAAISSVVGRASW